MSKAKLWLTFGLLLLPVETVADPATTSSKLTLRTGPGPAFAITAVMPAGAAVDVQICKGNWCRVQYGSKTGYASRHYLGRESATESYASVAPAVASREARPTLTGPRIWRWRDASARDEHWPDLGWHNRFIRR